MKPLHEDEELEWETIIDHDDNLKQIVNEPTRKDKIDKPQPKPEPKPSQVKQKLGLRFYI